MEKHCRQIRSQESKQASTTNDLSLAGEAYTLRTIFLPNHTSPLTFKLSNSIMLGIDLNLFKKSPTWTRNVQYISTKKVSGFWRTQLSREVKQALLTILGSYEIAIAQRRSGYWNMQVEKYGKCCIKFLEMHLFELSTELNWWVLSDLPSRVPNNCAVFHCV